MAMSSMTKATTTAQLPTMIERSRLRPDNPQALNGRGLAYWQKGELEKALADFDDALRLAPHDIDILIDRGGYP